MYGYILVIQEGYTPLHHAARQGRKSTVDLLLKYKADYSIQSIVCYMQVADIQCYGSCIIIS